MVSRTRISLKHGMAATFDALLFLTAVSVVVMTAILLSAPIIEDADEQAQTLVERTHLMLFRLTIQPALGGNGTGDPGGPFVSVSSVVVGIFDSAPGKVTIPAWLNSTIAMVLSATLEPRYSYIWTLSNGRSENILANPGHSPPSGGNIFVSCLGLGGDPGIRSTLAAWSSG